MIVAGIGCRKGVGAGEIIAALDMALAAHDRVRTDVAMLATGVSKHGEAGIVEASRQLLVPLHLVESAALDGVRQHLLTRSARSQSATGSSSLSEASALAAAGSTGRLLGPRTVKGSVTCALAEVQP